MSTGTEKHFTVDNTAFAEVHVQTKARDGDADLYVRKGSKASRSDFDKRSIGISSNETVVFTAASTGNTIRWQAVGMVCYVEALDRLEHR